SWRGARRRDDRCAPWSDRVRLAREQRVELLGVFGDRDRGLLRDLARADELRERVVEPDDAAWRETRDPRRLALADEAGERRGAGGEPDGRHEPRAVERRDEPLGDDEA